jgi:thiol:disulfide interchange protein DsbA
MVKFFKQLLSVAVLLISTSAFAEVQLGRDYTLLSPAQAVKPGEKIQVLEFFFYGCSHCFHLHPQLSAWEKKAPKDVELQLVPTIFRDSWEPMSRTFYALESLGQLSRLHDELFKAWNVDNIDLSDEAKITDFVVQRGVDRAKFSSVYKSFAINSKVSRSNQMVRDYAIRGTPTVIVDGKYVVTGLAPEVTIQVLNELLLKVRKERKGH